MSISANVLHDLEWRADLAEPWLCPPDDWSQTEQADPDAVVAALESSGEAHAVAVAALEGLSIRARVLVADEYAAIATILTDAAACPDPWVGGDPTRDPAWRDPQGRPVAMVRAERRSIAVRAAALDIAVRLGLSEFAVRTRAAHVDTLRERCPRVWSSFRAGLVSAQNATAAAQLAASLPDDAIQAWERFDETLATAAQTLSPGKFRLRARVVRERVHPESLEVRHQRAAEDRTAWFQADHDSMATLTVYGPADRVLAAHDRADAQARHLRAQPGEERTLAQLRADVLLDLMTTGTIDEAETRRRRPSVAITVPVMTLLGLDDEPATLDGYGPIDMETARRLAGEASSWVRILTHPISGTVLDVDRTTYRVPKALRRWLGVRDPVCIGPGCARPARECDIDHRLDWQYGGATADTNLGPLCEPHHVIKTKSRWTLYRDEMTGATWWISPTALDLPIEPAPW